jgi:hypothetical protein
MSKTSGAGESSQEVPDSGQIEALKESEDEASSRKLLEEVQRTFVNLDEARGRCYDPRALVEASHCLKLEFDVWQQNDAAEFATKLLDRLEISLKKWSPSHFKYLTHKFGLKTTKQKICKECGLKVSFAMCLDAVRSVVVIHHISDDIIFLMTSSFTPYAVKS